MANQQALDRMISDAYRRSPLSAALPYAVLAIALAALFVWRVAATAGDGDAPHVVNVY